MATLISYDGIGLAHGTSIAIGVGGTGDTLPTASAGPAGSLVKTTSDPDMADAFALNSADSYSIRWPTPSNSKNLAVRFYFKKQTSLPASAFHMASFYDTDTAANKSRFSLSGSGTPGQVRYYDSAAATHASPSNLIAPDLWYRYEAYVKADLNNDGVDTDGSVRYLVFEGHSTTPIYDSGWNTWPAGSGTEFFWLGKIGATADSDFVYAHILVTDDADTLLGPWVATPLTSTRFVKTASGLKPASAFLIKGVSGVLSVDSLHTKGG